MNKNKTQNGTSNKSNKSDFVKRTHNRNSSKGSSNKGSDDAKFESSIQPVVKAGVNDISWYAQNPQILADAASLAFATPLGGKYNVGSAYPGASTNVSIPGICALRIVPAVGISTDNSSPVNIAARNIYSFTRHANSGHSNYNSPDQMIFLMAMDNLYSLHAWMTRIYGVMRFYIPTNRYLAKALVESMGVDFEDIEGNMADFRFFINTLAVKMSSLCTPASMSYFSRHRWIYSNVYLDEPTVKAQCYHFTPDYFLRYEEMTGAQTFGVLKLTPIMTELSFSALRGIANSMVAAVMESEDMNIMSGDILKAFGEGNVLRIPTIDEDYVCVPVYNPEVLSQIHNTRIVGSLFYESLDDPFVSQNPDNGAILFNPQFRGYRGNKTDVLFDLPVDNPTPGDVMVASRLSVMSQIETEVPLNPNEVLFSIDSCGSDICSTATIVTFEEVDNVWAAVKTDTTGIMLFGADQGVLMSNVDLISKWHHFEQHPRILMVSDDDEIVGTTFLGGFSDTSNFTIVTADDLRKMHECALLSMFDVPGNGLMKA